MSRKTQQLIREVCRELADFLIEKNNSYGDSAIEPIRIFSSAGPVEQIRVRMDDKLNRIINGKTYPGDNDLKDLVGYWVLEQVALRKHPEQSTDFVEVPILSTNQPESIVEYCNVCDSYHCGGDCNDNR